MTTGALRGLGSLGAFDFGSSAGAVPKSSNINAAIGVIDTVDDSVGANDDLSDGWIVKLGNHSAHLGKVGKPLGAAEEKLAEPDGALRLVHRDVTNNISEVTAGGR